MNKGSGYYAQHRLLGKPKPNVDVACPSCLSTDVHPMNTHRPETAPHYYWRHYSCDNCTARFWVGVAFDDTNETVYASMSPNIESFYRYAIMFSHEQILNREFSPSKVKHGAGPIIGSSFHTTRADAIKYAKWAMDEWIQCNFPAVQNLSLREREVLFAKGYSLYIDVVTKIDFVARHNMLRGRLTPMSEEERARLLAREAELDAKLNSLPPQ